MAARGFRPTGETFRPDAPTTRGELAQWLALLVERSGSNVSAPMSRTAIEELWKYGKPEEAVDRGEIARWMSRILLPVPGKSMYRYGDLSGASADVNGGAARLLEHGIDSELWDGWSAYAPDGSLLFRPNTPLRHDAMFATLYLAQIGFGPSFFDHPLDTLMK